MELSKLKEVSLAIQNLWSEQGSDWIDSYERGTKGTARFDFVTDKSSELGVELLKDEIIDISKKL